MVAARKNGAHRLRISIISSFFPFVFNFLRMRSLALILGVWALSVPLVVAFWPQWPFTNYKPHRHENESYLDRAHQFLHRHPLVDTHNDFPLYVYLGCVGLWRMIFI